MAYVLTVIKNEPMQMLLLLAFALLSCLMIPLYFYVSKPKLGTTEWISRLDPVRFRPLKRCSLRGTDAVWALLAALCAGFLSLTVRILLSGAFWEENPLHTIRAVFPALLRATAPCAVFAVGVYLLLRVMYGKTTVALCLSILGGMMLRREGLACALLAFSLFFLYLWASRPLDKPLFPQALWLLLSALCYGAALLPCAAMIYLAPFYLIVYLVILIVRYRHGAPENRKTALFLSLLLVFLAFILGVFGLLVLFALTRGWLAYNGISLLLSKDFYAYMLSYIQATAGHLLHNPTPLAGVVLGDAFALLLGMVSLVPLLHGTIRLRESRCLLALLLLPFALASFLVSGYYFLLLPLLLCTGWTWLVLRERGRAAYPLMFAGAAVLFYFLQLLMM